MIPILTTLQAVNAKSHFTKFPIKVRGEYQLKVPKATERLNIDETKPWMEKSSVWRRNIQEIKNNLNTTDSCIDEEM